MTRIHRALTYYALMWIYKSSEDDQFSKLMKELTVEHIYSVVDPSRNAIIEKLVGRSKIGKLREMTTLLRSTLTLYDVDVTKFTNEINEAACKIFSSENDMWAPHKEQSVCSNGDMFSYDITLTTTIFTVALYEQLFTHTLLKVLKDNDISKDLIIHEIEAISHGSFDKTL